MHYSGNVSTLCHLTTNYDLILPELFLDRETMSSQETVIDEDGLHMNGLGENLWAVGSPFKYKIPGDGSHWEKLLEPLIEADRIQCAAWKGEAKNLVIFSGLFSSVLSTFVIQTTQSLQEDPSDKIVSLLSQIAGSLNQTGLSPSQFASVPTSSFSPSPSSIRINVLWLISLVLSLTAVLAAIVGLQ
ncbi:hypothetical protein CPC08DRAFT_765367 [Agrocybe pediades]|nr:hypothetical protein CPC08DRAFT_765367 [Agrocybe pediades]